MSWDPTYSFGTASTQPQPPTPTQTPTLAATFPSPAFQTPVQPSDFDDRSGWTPTFAEEYSVFNTTPGRLTVHHAFADTTPRPMTADHGPSASRDMNDGELRVHMHNFSPELPVYIPSTNQLAPSVSPDFSQSRFDEVSKETVTPRKSQRHLEEAFSGQTATPPQSSNGSRKLGPKPPVEVVQNYGSQQSFSDDPGMPTQQHMMAFHETSNGLFEYPTSARATAPIFNTKSLWDPDTEMGGMSMELLQNGASFNTSFHRPSNSLEWGRDNQFFQETMNLPQLPPQQQQQQQPMQGSQRSQKQKQKQKQQQPMKRQRPLAPKVALPVVSHALAQPPFQMAATSFGEHSFAGPSIANAVDPGLLFSRPSSSLTDGSASSGFEDILLPPTRPKSSQLVIEPYQHQLRESRRDQEELRRSRSTRENGSFRFDRSRGTASSPVRGSARPGLHRSISDGKSQMKQRRSSLVLPKGREEAQAQRNGRSSPLKQSHFASLHSIPESPDHRNRTEVKFTIDENGKARTETVVLPVSPVRKKQRPLTRKSGSWHSLSSDSSSDDEPILPSRSSSFAMPSHHEVPRYIRNELPSLGYGRRSSGSSFNFSDSTQPSNSRQDGYDSEAETVLDEDDEPGDATKELQKVMEDRRQMQAQTRRAQHHRYALDHRDGTLHHGYSSTTSSSAVTDQEAGTPSSSRSGSTRCVCDQVDGEDFMIQCESCDNWLHTQCVGIDRRSLPPVYICAFCANTPNKIRGVRKAARGSIVAASPLEYKASRPCR